MNNPIIQRHVSLQPYNTFAIAVNANYFCEVTDNAQISALRTQAELATIPWLIVGGGSNLLLTGDFTGLVINIALRGITIIKEDEQHVWLRIAAGENWHALVCYCIQQGWGGIENLSLIPGKVGAAPIQNIGAYGVELQQVFDHLQAVALDSGKLHRFNNSDCRFGYRDSIFKQQLKNQFIITDICLQLTKKNHTFNTSYGALAETLKHSNSTTVSLQAISDAVIAIRRSKLPDPAELGNAGSFFKNPVITAKQLQLLQEKYTDIPYYVNDNLYYKIPAAWLIEQAGFKGLRRGNVGVHSQQALVLVNYGNALGSEILQLANDVRAAVFEKFSVTLENEVNII